MAQTTRAAVADQTPRPRIVQFHGRRYSIRLEPVFWQSLEGLAENLGMRLGQFVAEQAEAYDGPNFASHLRILCMLDAKQSLAQASLRPDQGSLVDLVMGCASPGLVLSYQRTILACNESLILWLGGDRKAPVGAELTTVMQVRTRRPLSDIWDELRNGELARADINVLHVAPGRVIAAAARLLPLRAFDGGFYAVMWLTSAPRLGAPPPGRMGGKTTPR